MYKTTLLIAIAAVVLLGGQSLAMTYQIAPSDDTYSSHPFDADTNYGFDTSLKTWAGGKWPAASEIRNTFLKFTIPPLRSGETIKSATLRLYQYEGSSWGQSLGMPLHLLSNNGWSESTLTGNNTPGGTLTPRATNTDLPSHRGWSSWNFLWDTSFGNTVTLRINEEILGGYGESHEWYSKEYAGAYKPYLEITTSPAIPPAPSDFNADGKADLVWQHQVTGEIGVWFMDGMTQVGGSPFTPGQIDPDWKTVGVGDFNGDEKPDLVWHHQVTGEIGVWFMDGMTQIGGSPFTPGQADIDWKIVGVGDFNADGKPDLVWHHRTLGYIGVWLMDGVTQTGGPLFSPGQVAVEWMPVAVADIDLDGKPDIVWQHQTAGYIGFWFMDGTTQSGGPVLPVAVPDTNWQIIGTGDFNNDGKADLVWQHQVTGEIGPWLMSGTDIISTNFFNPSAVTDTNWRIVAP